MVSLLSSRAILSLPKLRFRGGFAPASWSCSSLVEAIPLPTSWGFVSFPVSRPLLSHFPCVSSNTHPHLHPKSHCTPLPTPSSSILSYPCFRASTIPSSPAARPPPEPPPPPPMPLFTFTEAFPHADLTTPRPDPKPPWLLSCGSAPPPIWLCFKGCIFMSECVLFLSCYGLCFYVYFLLLVSCYVLWCLVVVWFNFAFKVFVERPLLCWSFWKGLFHLCCASKSYTGTMAVISTFNSPSYRQAAFVHVVCLDHRETTYSRTVRFLDKEMIRNWIDSKTLASPSNMANYHGLKMFVWLRGLDLWIDVEPLWFVVCLCIDSNNVYVDHPECTVFSLKDLLVCNDSSIYQ